MLTNSHNGSSCSASCAIYDLMLSICDNFPRRHHTCILTMAEESNSCTEVLIGEPESMSKELPRLKSCYLIK